MLFYLWIAASVNIPTLDNLIQRGCSLVSWCFMCQCSGETVIHLLLQCDVAYILWTRVFRMFEIQWVMALTVPTLLFCWRNWFGKHSSNVWNLVSACLMWILWREWNSRMFDGVERSLNQLQSLIMRTSFDWSVFHF